jgi:hypothetical protein
LDVGIVTFSDYVTENEAFDYYIIGFIALLLLVGLLVSSITQRSQKAMAYCHKLKEKGKPDKWNTKKYITNSSHAYDYCRWVIDDPEVARNIKDPMHAYYYCRNIRMDMEVAQYIKGIYYPDFIKLVDEPGSLIIFTREEITQNKMVEH